LLIPDEGVLLLAEDNARALHGTLYERIIPLLDGSRGADDLIASLADAFDAAHVYYALMMLEKNGHLIEAVAVANAIPAEQAAFWSGLDLQPTAAVAALAAQPVALQSLGDVDPEPLQQALANLGVLDQLAFYDSRGRDSWALNLTSDLGIPAFVAVSRQRAGEQDRLLFGLGCHLDARIALQRAFAEMNQMLGMAQEQPEHGSAALEDHETQRWLHQAPMASLAPLTDLDGQAT